MATVLIVDDEQPVVDGVRHIIERFRPDLAVVATANSGVEAIEVARRTRPDIAFVDVRMPGISGLEAFEQIRAELPAIVGILATAYERFDIAQRAVQLGVFDYIVKPITRNRLIEALDGAAQRIEQRGERHGQTLSLLTRIHELLPAAEEIFIRGVARGQVVDNLLPIFEYRGIHDASRWKMAIVCAPQDRGDR